MEKKVYELKISDALEGVMPPLQDGELDLLTNSLLSEGCRDALVTWNGVIVDGHNRYRICRENRIPFDYIEMEFEDETAAKKWLVLNQLARRNVTDFVRCEMVLPMEAELRAEAKKRKIRKPAGFVPPTLAGQKEGDIGRVTDFVPPTLAGQKNCDVRDELAQMACVSHGTLDKARKLINEADEETKDKLRKGEMSIHRAFTALRSNDLPEGDTRKEPSGLVPKLTEDQMQPAVSRPRYGCIVNLPPTAENAREFFPDSLYDTPPISTFGMTSVDNLEFRSKAEMIHAKSDLTIATEQYVRRVGEILRPMTEASINGENAATLREIVTKGYNQIMEFLTFGGTVLERTVHEGSAEHEGM